MNYRPPWLLGLVVLLAACNDRGDSVRSAFEDLTPAIHRDWPYRHSELNVPVVAAESATIEDRGMPPNSLPSIMHLAEEEDLWIETDIQITADGEFILYGNAQLEETSNGYGLASEHTLDELQALLLKDDKGKLTTYHISTLKEVLYWNAEKGGQLLLLDPQVNVPLDSLVRMVENSKHLKSVIIDVEDPEQADYIWKLNPEVFISIPVNGLGGFKVLVDKASYMPLMTGDTASIVDPVSAIDSLHKSDLAVIRSTALDQPGSPNGELYDKLLEVNTDIILTNNPLYMKDYFKKIKSKVK